MPSSPERAIGRAIARQHLIQQGKHTAYELSPELHRELGFQSLLIEKGVGRLSAREVEASLRACREPGGEYQTSDVLVVRSLHELYFSLPRELDERILAAAEGINAEGRLLKLEIAATSDPIEKMEMRRRLGRRLIGSAAVSALQMAAQDRPGASDGAAFGIVGSYNHSPLPISDLDYVLIADGSASHQYLKEVVLKFERICSLLPIDVSNFIRINSGGRLEFLELQHFAHHGFRICPRSSSIKIGLLDLTWLENAGTPRIIRQCKETARVHIEASGFSPMEAARIKKIFDGKCRRAIEDPRAASRLAEKVIVSALSILSISCERPCVIGGEHRERLLRLQEQGMFDMDLAEKLGAAIFTSRILSEAAASNIPLTARSPMLRHSNQISPMALFQTASEFFELAFKSAGMNSLRSRICQVILDLSMQWQRFKSRRLSGGREVKAVVRPASLI